MPSGDGLLVRLRPPGGALRADAARALADAAARDGNGVIELTQRAAIQVRGLSAAALPRFTAATVAAGLADPDAVIERRRTMVFPPLGGADAAAVAGSIEFAMSHDPWLGDLPEKFFVSMDAGGALPLGDLGADICVMCEAQTFRVGLAGSSLAAVCGPHDVADAVVRLARAFCELVMCPLNSMAARKTLTPTLSQREREQAAQRLPLPLGEGWGEGLRLPSPPRMRTLVAAIGAQAVFATAGLRPFGTFVPSETRPAVGPIGGAFGLGLAFGACDAAALTALVDISERFGDGELRLTPWRAFVLTGVALRDRASLHSQGAALGLIVSQQDARRHVTACVGQPGCSSATVDARRDAAALAALPLTLKIHISGCAKGCAHPAATAVTLVGADGRYNFVRNGRAADAPVATGLTIAQATALLNQEAA